MFKSRGVRSIRALGVLFSLVMIATPALVWAGERVEVTLLDGKRIRGELVSREGGKVTVKVSKTETLILPASIVESTRSLEPKKEKKTDGVKPPDKLAEPRVPAVTRDPESTGETLGRVAVETLAGTAGGLVGAGLGAVIGGGLTCGFDFEGVCLTTANQDAFNLGILLGGLVGYGASSTGIVWGIGSAFGAKGSYTGSLIGFAGGTLATIVVLTNTQDLTVLALPALATVLGYEISHFMTPLAGESGVQVLVVPRTSGAQLSVSWSF